MVSYDFLARLSGGLFCASHKALRCFDSDFVHFYDRNRYNEEVRCRRFGIIIAE